MKCVLGWYSDCSRVCFFVCLSVCPHLSCMPASSPGSVRVLHWRAWCFFSCDLSYVIVCGQDWSKDGCISLPFAGDSISALSLWYKWAPNCSYKKCRFAAFLCLSENCSCSRPHKNLPFSMYPLSTLRVMHVGESTRPTASQVKRARGPGNEATCM